MNDKELYHFKLLKEAVFKAFSENKKVSKPIEAWKGETIVAFQEDLFEKLKAKVSEKWFYTYFKNTPEKLPRVDMLNLLSKYAGYDNWDSFIASNESEISISKKRKPWLALLVLIPLIMAAIWYFNNEYNYHFCFIDSIKGEPITQVQLDITVLDKNESPLYFKTDSSGCFNYSSKEKHIELMVSSPFHKTDTIFRQHNSNKNPIVKLKTDDYALMLHYYTNNKIKDWKAHKAQLTNLFSEKVQIYRLYKNSINVELYTKDEFINTLTIPTKALRDIDILDKTVVDGKITSLKFIMNE
ncbi:hypothetical protein [Winogradskyella sp. 3972H.M.0a.05]|uniref:hypothetical protein n=1 Tax=Winogradskyella sp. 3972H.M.0a.05 TaxID=2950277 RepID=UPI003399792C